MTTKNAALDFVRYVLGEICEHPSEILVEFQEDDRGAVLMVRVNEEDMGRVIGKSGATIDALRTLVTNVSAREGQRIALKLVEEEKSAEI